MYGVKNSYWVLVSAGGILEYQNNMEKSHHPAVVVNVVVYVVGRRYQSNFVMPKSLSTQQHPTSSNITITTQIPAPSIMLRQDIRCFWKMLVWLVTLGKKPISTKNIVQARDMGPISGELSVVIMDHRSTASKTSRPVTEEENGDYQSA